MKYRLPEGLNLKLPDSSRWTWRVATGGLKRRPPCPPRGLTHQESFRQGGTFSETGLQIIGLLAIIQPVKPFLIAGLFLNPLCQFDTNIDRAEYILDFIELEKLGRR